MMEFRNSRFNVNGTIDLEANHPSFGWIPMTVSKDDQVTADMYEAAKPYTSPYEPPPVSASQLYASLAARRYKAEISGTTHNGNFLATDRETQSKITAAYVKAKADPSYKVESWKFAPGLFVELDADKIIGLAGAIESHVQACFSNEARISKQILNATTQEQLNSIDLESGWP